MLERLVPEVKIESILSTGDVVGGSLGGSQFSGIPDGLGAYESSDSTIDVLVNHELGGSAPSGVSSRVSQLQLNEGRRVLSARYVIDGTEGFLRFCSSTLAGIDGVPWYFTGEESTNSAGPPAGGKGGSSIALNALTGGWYETRHFGLFAHENVTPVKRPAGGIHPLCRGRVGGSLAALRLYRTHVRRSDPRRGTAVGLEGEHHGRGWQCLDERHPEGIRAQGRVRTPEPDRKCDGRSARDRRTGQGRLRLGADRRSW